MVDPLTYALLKNADSTCKTATDSHEGRSQKADTENALKVEETRFVLRKKAIAAAEDVNNPMLKNIRYFF